jgi:hypothetical protein
VLVHKSWLRIQPVVCCAGCPALSGFPGVCCTCAPAFLPRVCSFCSRGCWTGEGDGFLLLKMWGLLRFFRLGARVECVCFVCTGVFLRRVSSSRGVQFVCVGRVQPTAVGGWVVRRGVCSRQSSQWRVCATQPHWGLLDSVQQTAQGCSSCHYRSVACCHAFRVHPAKAAGQGRDISSTWGQSACEGGVVCVGCVGVVSGS